MKNRPYHPIFFFIFFFISFAVFPQLDLKQTIPVDEKVRIGRLENGLTYYIRKNSRPENKLELRLVVNAGSILEEDNQQGLAHFTEHMAFNGSKKFKKNDIVSFLQSIGVEFGADLNAYTGFDETVYILPIPTQNRSNIEKGFQILEDWASTVSFDSKELEKERGVVLEEERLGKGADERIFRVTYPKMFEGSKYAQRLPIGKAEVIKSFQPEIIRKFYKDWYRPDLMAVIAVGDYDPFELELLIKKHFSHLKNPNNSKDRIYFEVPPRKLSEALVVTDKEATNHVIQILYPYEKSKPTKFIADYQRDITRAMVLNMLSLRLQELTQKPQPPFIFGSSSSGSWVRGYEGFSSVAYIGEVGPGAAIEALIQENERARRFGFTASELERVKKTMLKNIQRSFNEKEKTESRVFTAEYVRHFLEAEPVPGIEKEHEYFNTIIPNVSLEHVNHFSKEFIPGADAPKLIIFTGPDSADFKIPAEEELLVMVHQASTADIHPYQEKALGTSLLDHLPTPGKIIKETTNVSIGTTELELTNGIRVILKPTDFKNDQVIMLGSRFGGQYTFQPDDRLNVEYANAVISQMGVGNFSPLDLRKFLAGKSVNVSARIGSTSELVNGQCSTSDLETMLELTYLNFLSPRRDQELFDSFISKQKSYYKNMTLDPEFVFQDSLLSILYQNHPWAPRLPKAENFSSLDIDRIIHNYKTRFGNAYGFRFVITGRFDVDEIKPMIEKYLGSLPSHKQEMAVIDVGLRPVRGIVKKNIKKGAEEKSLVRMFWNGEAPFSESDNLHLNMLIELLQIKITETLREDASGVYSTDIYGSLNKFPYNHYSIGMSLPCAPQNVNALVASALDEIQKIKLKGPLEEDLAKVKETKKQQHLIDLKENSYWARKLLQAIEHGSNPEDILTIQEKINAVTRDHIRAAAMKYFDMNNYVQVVLDHEK